MPVDPKVVEILARGYHNGINEVPWESLPENPTSFKIENRRDLLSWMSHAIEVLEQEGYVIAKQNSGE